MKTLSRIFRPLYLLHVTLCYTLRPFILGSTDSAHFIGLCDKKCRDRLVSTSASYPRGLCFEPHLENELLVALFSLVN